MQFATIFSRDAKDTKLLFSPSFQHIASESRSVGAKQTGNCLPEFVADLHGELVPPTKKLSNFIEFLQI